MRTSKSSNGQPLGRRRDGAESEHRECRRRVASNTQRQRATSQEQQATGKVKMGRTATAAHRATFRAREDAHEHKGVAVIRSNCEIHRHQS